jgi:mannose-6-phosphate isomerase-like protein (cupin superfamily)
MTGEKYLIDINDKENWLRVNLEYNPDGTLNEEQRIITYPEGINLRFEFTDSIFYGKNSYHEHTFGYEFFFVVDGKMDFTTHGKVCTVTDGDILFVPPYTSHKMEFLCPTRWRATYHDMDMCGLLNDWNRIQKFIGDKLNDPLLNTSYLANRQNIVREAPIAVRVDKREVPEVRTIDTATNRYDFDGLVMKQVVSRAESGGGSEMWRFEMEDGFAVEYQDIVPNADFFYITEGEVEFTAGGKTFTAYRDCLVKIPHYVPRSFRSKGKSAMYDIGGMTHWLDAVEDYRSVKTFRAEKLNDKDFIRNILHRHACYVKAFGKEQLL